MILVALGTQDRQFTRLLEAIEKEIKRGTIKDRVVVQAGVTKFESEHMEIYDLIPYEEFVKLYDECDLLICHGGVGTIIDGLKRHKKIIAAARLKEYGEHQNNHQKQIIREFTKKHLILELDDFDKLGEKLEEIKTFVPGEYKSNSEHFIELLDEYIDSTVCNQKGNDFRKFMQYGFYGLWAILFEMLFLFVFSHFEISLFLQTCFAGLIVVFYRFLIQKIFFSNIKKSILGEITFLAKILLQLLFVWLFPNFFAAAFLMKMFGLSIICFFLVFGINVLFHVKDVE